MRAWLAFSGVLFVVDWMRPQMREIAVYNPLTHAITLFRDGLYVNYPTNTLDVQYLLLSTAVCVSLAWLVERLSITL